MKKIFKKSLSVLLAAVMVFGIAPLNGFVGLELPEFSGFKKFADSVSGFFDGFATKAAAVEVSGYYTYSVTYYGKASIEDVDESISGEITIPANLGGYPVVWIADNAFSNCDKITSVFISDGIEYIGENAFFNCTGLEKVEFGESELFDIGSYAFSNCTNLEKLVFSGSDFYIYEHVFEKCSSLKNVSLPENIKHLGDYVFDKCTSLESVQIYNDELNLSGGAFRECSSLISVTIPGNSEKIGGWAFEKCTSLKEIIIPDSIKTIDQYAFLDCTNLETVSIGTGVTVVGVGAFSGCTSLEKISIPDNVTGIGGYAFAGCTNLKTVNINGDLKSIKGYLFSNCIKLESILIPDSVTTIYTHAFDNCSSLKDIVISDNVTVIEDFAFSGCSNLTDVTIPNSVTEIWEGAFSGCYVLANIYYKGTQEQWESINLDSDFNWYLIDYATIHFMGDDSESDFSDYTQTHVVSDYSDKNDKYEAMYFDGNAVALDGMGGNADLCVPGLTKDDNMVPQGITYYPQKDWILVSAYSKSSGTASAIFALDRATGKYVAQFDVYNNIDENKKFSKKLGGIAVSNNNLYLTNNSDNSDSEKFKAVSYIPLSEFDVDRGTYKKVEIKGTKYLSDLFGQANVSYLSFSDGVLYAGNFYNETKNYNKPVTDKINSMVFGYKLSGTDSKSEWKAFYEAADPDYRYVIPNSIMEIQGAAVKNGYLYLSSSFGRKYDSTLYVVKVGNGTAVSFEDADYSCSAPPLMEGITFIGNDLYTVFESGAYFYREKDWYNKAKNPTDVIWKLDCQSVLKETENHFASGDCENYNVLYGEGTVSLSFKQSWFKNDSLQYKHEIAQLCSQFVTLGYSTDSLMNGLKSLGFNSDRVLWETYADKTKVDNFIADREITVNGETYTLLFVGCIGTNTVQWYSNFEPGTGETHASFNDAKNYVYQNISKYINMYGIDISKTKILLCGHSRGAATANLVAAKLIDEEIYATKENVYTYTFATPNPTSSSDRFDEKYDRIFNFVNPEDFVTKVIPAQWGYGRYGTTYALPSKTNTAGHKTLRANMQAEYDIITNNQRYHPYPDGETQTYNVIKRLTSTVRNIAQLYVRKFTWLGETVSIQEFFTQTLCKFMANEEGTDERKEAQSLLVDTWLFKRKQSDASILSLTDYFVVYQGVGGLTDGWIMEDYFQEAHQAETYCAYMMSMTASQATTVREAYENTVNCPVDVEVYDKVTGEIVGRIVNNVVDEEIAAKENSVVMSVNGDSKSFWLPSDGEYYVKLIGNDDGIMDYTVASIDSSGAIEAQRVNFVQVDITDNKSMTGKFTGEDFILKEYALTTEDGNNIGSDDIITSKNAEEYECEIGISTVGDGSASGDGIYTKGDCVTLSAVPATYGEFIGWFENEELVSTDSMYSFVVKSERKLTAKFSKFEIRLPSTTTISYGDSIILHADVAGTLPDGATIQWFADNGNFEKVASNDGSACKITPKSSGDTTFTIKVVSADGEVLAEDTQVMTSEAGFFDKLIAFFKKIFGLTKTISQAFKFIY